MNDKTDDPVARALDPEAWDTAMLNDFTLDLVMFPRRQESLVNARAARIAVIKEMIEELPVSGEAVKAAATAYSNITPWKHGSRCRWSAVHKAMLTAKLKELEDG